MVELKKYDTVVIGGGASGIASALRRRKRGDKVLLLEKNEKIGGKLDIMQWKDYRWDKGPSLFTLPQLVNELFELYGKNSKDYFDYHDLQENTRYHFNDGTQFTFYGDSIKRKEELSKWFTDDEVEKVEVYINKISETYEAIGDLFIERPKLRMKDAFKPEVLKQYPNIVSRQMLNSLNAYNERMLGNDKLVQLFNRFGTYNGSNPYKMSGLYSMIPHLELNIGTYFPKGGMRAIVESLEKLMIEEGVDIALNEDAVKIVNINGKYEIETSQGNILAKNVICAIDHVNFYDKILKDEALLTKYKKEERSSSAVVFYWAMDRVFDEIGLHNIFFSEDYPKEFEELFDVKVTPEDPTIYVHNSSAVEKEDAPEGGQNWFVMIHSPAGRVLSDDDMNKVREMLITKLEKFLKKHIRQHIVFEDYWNMQRVERITGSYQGALYGGAFNSKMASFKRHGNKSDKYKNLYFAGGSVHPGGGIPLVLKSAKIVDQLMQENG